MVRIYKANKSNKGASAQFQTRIEGEGWKKNISLYATFSRQETWDDSSRTGTFCKDPDDFNNRAVVKFSDGEIGSILSCLKCYEDFSYYHSSGDKNNTKGGLSYVERNGKDGKLLKGFIFSVSKNGSEKINLGINMGEAQLLIIYLENSLKKYYDEFIVGVEEYASNKKSNSNKKPSKPLKNETEEENPLRGLIDDDNDDNDDDTPFN